jgi:hypothetical protein
MPMRLRRRPVRSAEVERVDEDGRAGGFVTARDTRASTLRSSTRSSAAIVGLSSPTVAPILASVGMNPFRPHKRRASDYVMVAAAFVICALLVAWAIHG